MVVGLASSVILAFIGPAFLKGHAIFPIVNLTILSMPLGFVSAWAGTMMTSRRGRRAAREAHEARFNAFMFKAHTGFDPERERTAK